MVSSQGPVLGFNINLKKCELYGAGDHSSFPSAIQTSNTYHLELLGAPIGDSEYCNQFFSKKLQSALALLSTLEEIGSIDPQIALALLRLCSCFCKLIHTRVTPPHLILNAMQRYDAGIHHSFANCTGNSLDPLHGVSLCYLQERAGLSSHLEVGSDWGQDCSRTRSRHLCHQLRQRHLSAFDVTVTSLLNSSVIMEVGMYPGDAARAAEFRKHSDNEQNVLN
ncbi:hypothetical protein EMCRGX_G015209 [Ephydatia muelleri]